MYVKYNSNLKIVFYVIFGISLNPIPTRANTLYSTSRRRVATSVAPSYDRSETITFYRVFVMQ